ncbi:hypothetical protein EDD25_1197 [Cryobacterium psychrophilum]|nr:hypothetical protein EDD25_1197 [Cryobacterium psychrophilum]
MEPRETSSATISLILGYVRAHRGDQAVHDVLALAQVELSPEQLLEPSSWVCVINSL